MAPTKIYVRAIQQLMTTVSIKGIAHITGGGISENIPRVLPGDLHAEIDINSWQPGPVFDWLAVTGRITPAEMRRTFNCGIGMIVVVGEHDVATAIESLRSSGETAMEVGSIVDGAGEVAYV